MNAQGSAGPLHGRVVAVTRPEQGAAELAAAIRSVGAEPFILPLIRTVAPRDPRPLLDCLNRLPAYGWIVFTSANAVDAVAAVVGEAEPPRARVAAIGPATAAALRTRLGWTPTLVPAQATGADLAAAMAALAPLRNVRVLWPRARNARPELPRALEAAGALLDAPETYGTESVAGSAARLHGMITARTVDAVTFTSPSAVDAFATAGARTGEAVVAVIGASTAAAARRHGMTVHVEPQEHTIAAMIDGLTHWWRSR